MDRLPTPVVIAAFLTCYGLGMLWAIGRDRVLGSIVLIALGLGLMAGMLGAALLGWFE